MQNVGTETNTEDCIGNKLKTLKALSKLSFWFFFVESSQVYTYIKFKIGLRTSLISTIRHRNHRHHQNCKKTIVYRVAGTVKRYALESQRNIHYGKILGQSGIELRHF